MKLRLFSIGLSAFLGALVACAGVSGCAGSRYEQSTGERIDDRATSLRVKKALADDTKYKYPQVEVKTFKGTVQLSGFANTREEKSCAGDIAKSVPGVKDVENNITVKP